MAELTAGLDFRLPEHRRETFLRFYSFHLKYRTHPGCVYFLLPAMAEALGWDLEQRLWAAYLNGNTQNPVTTLLLMEAGDRPAQADRVVAFWKEHWQRLQWDTDRRHHKGKLDIAAQSYVGITQHYGTQERFWRSAAEEGWGSCWTQARSLWGFGRLSAWSYLEYVRILARPEVAMPDAADLMLEDVDGSRSHRNGLCVVTGRPEWLWDDTLAPGSTAQYTPDRLEALGDAAESLLAEAQARNADSPDVGRLTLESALCTYKSWHKPNRRYPNVYADMLYERLRWAEERWGHRFDLLWEARARALPAELLLERNPYDPGLAPPKQNHYLETGQVVMMDLDWPCFANDFAANVRARVYGPREATTAQGQLL